MCALLIFLIAKQVEARKRASKIHPSVSLEQGSSVPVAPSPSGPKQKRKPQGLQALVPPGHQQNHAPSTAVPTAPGISAVDPGSGPSRQIPLRPDALPPGHLQNVQNAPAPPPYNPNYAPPPYNLKSVTPPGHHQNVAAPPTGPSNSVKAPFVHLMNEVVPPGHQQNGAPPEQTPNSSVPPGHQSSNVTPP